MSSTGNDVARRFGENLSRQRKRANLSQEELAVLTTLHRTEIGMLERGGRLPRIDTLVKLSTALDIPADDLLEGIVWIAGSSKKGQFACAEPR